MSALLPGGDAAGYIAGDLDGETAGNATVQRWDLPEFDDEPESQPEQEGLTVQQLEEIERAAYEEAYKVGYDEGREAGLAAARVEMQPLIEQLRSQTQQLHEIWQVLARPLEELDAEVEEQLVKLALTVGQQLARRELRIDPAQVIAIVRECVALLPATARDVRVHLHPEDAAVVREHLATPAAERAWSIVEDPVLSRGGCRVTTETAQIDARLETRVASVVGTIMGEERRSARETE